MLMSFAVAIQVIGPQNHFWRCDMESGYRIGPITRSNLMPTHSHGASANT